jgi:hypothetical protein
MERPREFQTADGFVLAYDEAKNDWSDGDLVFDARRPDLWPIDSAGEPLAGRFIQFGYAPPADLIPAIRPKWNTIADE